MFHQIGAWYFKNKSPKIKAVHFTLIHFSVISLSNGLGYFAISKQKIFFRITDITCEPFFNEWASCFLLSHEKCLYQHYRGDP